MRGSEELISLNKEVRGTWNMHGVLGNPIYSPKQPCRTSLFQPIRLPASSLLDIKGPADKFVCSYSNHEDGSWQFTNWMHPFTSTPTSLSPDNDSIMNTIFDIIVSYIFFFVFSSFWKKKLAFNPLIPTLPPILCNQVIRGSITNSPLQILIILKLIEVFVLVYSDHT